MLAKEKGQSLIEVVVALAAALLVILALVRVAVTSMRNASLAKNQALATQYSQEAMERIRAFRDQTDWTTFTTGGCQSPPELEEPPPPFAQAITCSLEAGDKMKITVIVSWTDAIGPHSSELSSYLTDWD